MPPPGSFKASMFCLVMIQMVLQCPSLVRDTVCLRHQLVPSYTAVTLIVLWPDGVERLCQPGANHPHTAHPNKAYASHDLQALLL
jgi:hypothetical protein